MTSITFTNLKPAKKERIEQALLIEFSNYPLSKAQVARIIKQAEIARGSFYKYFTDLTDAYLYILHKALTSIHVNLQDELSHSATDSLKGFYDYTVKFIHKIQQSDYCGFYRLFWQENQYYLQSQKIKIPAHLHFIQDFTLRINQQPLHDFHKNQIIIILLMRISHEVIKQILNGQKETQVLEDFKSVLTVIKDGLQYEERLD